MVFSNTTTKEGIIEEIATFCFGSSANDDTTAYPLADKTRFVNRWYDRVVSLILQVDGQWQWDDVNNASMPITGSTNLASGTQSYALSTIAATDYLKIVKVAIKNQSGKFFYLNPFNLKDYKEYQELLDTSRSTGTPTQYAKFGNHLVFDIIPSYSATAGIKVYFQRGASYFISTDTTKEPGFAAPFHRILALGSAYDWCLANSLFSKISVLKTEIKELEAGLVEYYSSRNSGDAKLTASLQREDFGQDEDTAEEGSLNWN